jgi:uncharacterized delta-60 repeat protein
MKNYIVLFLFLTLLVSLNGQVDTAWTRRWTSTVAGGSDYVYGLAVDSDGNVYITGASDYLGSTPDLLIIKYNSAGDTVWTRVPVRTGSQMTRAVAVSLSGNIYITGYTMENGHGDYITIKYRPNGDEAWVRIYSSSGSRYDFSRKLIIDAQENIYISGYSQESNSRYTHATVKYDSSGNQLWAKRDSFGGAGSLSYPADLTLDNNGNPCIVSKTATASQGTDYVIAKYNTSNGETLWVRTYNGTANGADDARAIVSDNQGNIYVTGMTAGSGTGNDITIIKYNSSGVLQWQRSFSNPDTNATDAGYWIALDNFNNVYVYGSSYGTGSANSDLVVIKYDASNGNEQWVARYNGPGGYDLPIEKDGQKGMAIDHYGNIYIAGTSRQTGSTNENDYVTVKYNPNGIQQWVARYDYADSFETVWSMDVDNSGNVYVAGRSVAPVSYYDGLTIKYVQAVGIEENHYSQTADLSLLEIFPNPAKSFFVVRGPLSADIKMYNVSGKLVKVEEVNTQFASSGQRFSLKGINPGVYFVRIGNQTMVKKLVVFE